MPIKGPKGAHPTTRGWESAKGELLKSQRISEDQITEWNDEMNPKPQVLRESPVTEEEVIEEHIGDPLEHTHEDGTNHSHEGGDVDHTHDKPKKSMMSKLFS